MAYLLSPLFNDAQFDSDGAPLVGGKLHWYQAGTTTPSAVYTDATGATSHANPIILNARGEALSPIYLDDSISYKAVLTDSDDAVIRTIDGIEGISSPSGDAQSEWVVFAGPPTFVDADEFSVAGDQTAIFHVGRRVRLSLSGSTLCGTIAASSYGVATTIQVTLDSGSIDGTIASVAYGVLSASNSSVPGGPLASWTYTPTGYTGTNTTAVTPGNCTYMRVGNIVTVAGVITATVTTGSDTATTFRISLPIASNFASASDAAGSFQSSFNIQGGFVRADAASDTMEFFFYSDVGGDSPQFWFTAQYVIR